MSKPSSKVIAVCVADIHLSHVAPTARSAEPDWYAAQKRYLDQLGEVAREFKVPIICAGDVFDRWSSPPELINFAIRNIPRPFYSVAGQHDTPHHQQTDMHKSAYQTLVEAGVIVDVGGWHGKCIRVKGVNISLLGFPWGSELRNADVRLDGCLKLAVVHHYVWTAGKGYPMADSEDHVGRVFRHLEGFDTIVSGDNHQRFQAMCGEDRWLANCGRLIPRKSDEQDGIPAVMLLHDDGHFVPRPLDCSEDKWLEVESKQAGAVYDSELMDAFLSELGDLGDCSLDFREALRHRIEKTDVSQGVRRLLADVLERSERV